MLPDSGNNSCKTYTRRYFYNPKIGKCLPFNYSGCEGNNNNFDGFFACRETCSKLVSAKNEPLKYKCDLPLDAGTSCSVLHRGQERPQRHVAHVQLFVYFWKNDSCLFIFLKSYICLLIFWIKMTAVCLQYWKVTAVYLDFWFFCKMRAICRYVSCLFTMCTHSCKLAMGHVPPKKIFFWQDGGKMCPFFLSRVQRQW